jgi:dTDP-4-dehydrorhamnose reductase
MRIGVIGSNGLVGRAICKELKAVGITRDNYPDKVGLKGFDVLINANGNSSKWQANDNPEYDFTANVESVNYTMTDFEFKKYIYISSYDVGKDSTYGLHKMLAEEIVKHYTNFIILRCPIIIGKRMKKGFLYDALRDTPLYVNGDSEYQIITNTELAKIIKVLIEKKIENEIFNVGSTDTLRVGDLEVLLNKKITYRDDAKYERYEENVSEIEKLYPLKTAAQYIEDEGNCMKNRIKKLLMEKRISFNINDAGNSLRGILLMIKDFLTPKSIMAEIGCCEGKSTEMFALHVKKIFAIDPWEKFKFPNSAQSHKIFNAMAAKYSNIKTICGFSQDAFIIDKFIDHSLDAVYIDGNHSYESVKKDIISWREKIKLGGVLCGHDYQDSNVRLAITETINNVDKIYSDQSWAKILT